MPRREDEPEAHTHQPGRTATKRKDEAELDAINASLDALIDRSVFTSRDPYILTIPQTVEPRYHHRNHYQAEQFADNTPFSRSEWENLQYQTYHYHDPEHSMFRQEVNEYVDEPVGKPKVSTSTVKTPSAGPKKVISLDAYKKQKVGGTPLGGTPTREQDTPGKPMAVKHPVERVKAETAEIMAGVEEAEKVGTVSNEKKVDLKRKWPGVDTEDVNAVGTEPREATRGSKKARPSEIAPTLEKPLHSQPPATSDMVLDSQETMHESQEVPDRNMPPKLSPLRESYDHLPDRLSPTLPANIKAALTTRGEARVSLSSTTASAPNSASKKDGKLTPSAGVNVVKKHKSPIPRNGFRASSSSRTALEESQADDRLQAPRAASRSSERSLVVKLKFKDPQKKLAQKVKQPTEDAYETTSRTPTVQHEQNGKSQDSKRVVDATAKQEEQPTSTLRTGKGVAQKIGPPKKHEETSSNAERRSKPELDSAPHIWKRSATSESAGSKDRPITPGQHDAPSPESSLKSHPLTPGTRKDLRTIAMNRTQSNDSLQNTPSANPNTPLVNGSAFQPYSAPRPPATLPSSKTAKQQAWEAEQKRLETLGRELKHEAQAHSKSSPPEKQQAALKSLESFICYLLAFTCADEAADAAEPKQAPSSKPWRSLSGFFKFVKHSCAPFPILTGLACMLGVVFASHILRITERFPAEGPSRDSLIEITGIVIHSASDVEAKLDFDTLADCFRQTWKARTRNSTAIEDVRKVNELLRGGYRLPIGPQTPPVQAARAGYAMLGEWLDRERLEYRLRLQA